MVNNTASNGSKYTPNKSWYFSLIQIGIIICGGLYQISMGERNDFLKDPNPETPSIGRVATAFYSGLW